MGRTLLVMLFLFAATKAFAGPREVLPAISVQVVKGDTVRMVFTPDMTKDDLLRIKDELAVQGVELVYWVMRFNKAGQLNVLRFHVSDGMGHSGSATTDHLTEEVEFGFLFDNTRKSKIKLTVGNLRKE